MDTLEHPRVLIVGAGGREHALGMKLAADNPGIKLFFAPGNGGTGEIGRNLPMKADDIVGLAAWAGSYQPEMTIVGPEVPLSKGLADSLMAQGSPVFGPTQGASEIESSKAFAKEFMVRHGIPTARFASFTDYHAAVDHVRRVGYPVVIKASGLAAGKGVEIPEDTYAAVDTLDRFLRGHEHKSAGDTVVVEERLEGDEVSLLAFTDGRTVRPMVTSQDHKRLRDEDKGPNTGGMGAYAPVPMCPPELVGDIMESVLEPAVSGLAEEGRPFIGVLYAGIMLTKEGPKVLEFNCRFGDPETQVVLPLMETDLLRVTQACVNRRLDEVEVRWRKGAAACVVLASRGYPEKPETGYEITGLDTVSAIPNAQIYHAGTMVKNGKLVTSGGRVLVVTGWGDSLSEALSTAYRAADAVSFEGMQFRRDIGQKGIPR